MVGGLQLELVWTPTGLRAPFTFRAWKSFQEARGSGSGLAQAWIFIFPMIQHPKLTQARSPMTQKGQGYSVNAPRSLDRWVQILQGIPRLKFWG